MTSWSGGISSRDSDVLGFSLRLSIESSRGRKHISPSMVWLVNHLKILCVHVCACDCKKKKGGDFVLLRCPFLGDSCIYSIRTLSQYKWEKCLPSWRLCSFLQATWRWFRSQKDPFTSRSKKSPCRRITSVSRVAFGGLPRWCHRCLSDSIHLIWCKQSRCPSLAFLLEVWKNQLSNGLRWNWTFHVLQMINRHDLWDPVAFPLAPSARQR